MEVVASQQGVDPLAVVASRQGVDPFATSAGGRPFRGGGQTGGRPRPKMADQARQIQSNSLNPLTDDDLDLVGVRDEGPCRSGALDDVLAKK